MKEEHIFHNALEKPADERAAFLDSACGGDAELRERVEVLLEAHANPGSFLASPAHDVDIDATLDQPITEKPGMQIGPYKLLQQIGEGGFGVVYMAEQSEPVERRVALKIIKPGMDTRQVIARFEAERQALAMMDHPNIATVLDAGTTESGRPYFVMELVKGIPITKYCDQQHLTPKERLDLFIPVCQAVQHAHHKGIIHRDLKPSNVLIALYDDRPVPKVIDFGVAKATSQKLTEKTMFTHYGQVIGTLEYMSPEQANLNQLDIDTRSDIYSLGVLLYELLTGDTPFDRQRLRTAAFDEMMRIIREEEPPRPSTRLSTSESLPSVAANRHTEPKKLSTLVRGELDWIVMKALEKDRSRRYETANGFANDIERYLNDEAVVACPPSIGYRFRKFARRNKATLAIVSVAAAVLVAVAIGASVSAARFRDLATRNANLAAEKQTALTSAIAAEEAATKARDREAAQREEAERQTKIAMDALAEARRQRERAESNLDLALKALDDMYVEAIGRDRMLADRDTMHMGHRQLTSAEKKLLKAGLNYYMQITQQNADGTSAMFRTAMAYYHAGMLQVSLGDPQAAEAAFRKASDLLAALTDSHPENAAYHREFGRVCVDLGYLSQWPPDVRTILEEAVGALDRAIALSPNDADAYHFRGNAYAALSRAADAIADYEKAVELEPNAAWRHYHLASALGLGMNLLHTDRDLAIEHAKRAVELAPEDALFRALLGRLFWHMLNDREHALEELDKAVQLEPRSAFTYVQRTIVLVDSGDPQRALEDITEALRINPTYSYALRYRSKTYQRLGRLEEALNDLNEAQRHGPGWSLIYEQRGWLFMEMKRYEEAVADFSKAIELAPAFSWPRVGRARAYLQLGQYVKVLLDLKRASELHPNAAFAWWQIKSTLVNERSDPEAHYLLAIARTHLDHHEEAQRSWERGEELLAQQQGQPDESLSQLRDQARSMVAVGQGVLTYVHRSRDLCNKGNYKEALQNANRGLLAAPEDLGLLRERALAYGQLRMHEEALADWNRYLELEPGAVVPALIRAQMLLIADRTDEYHERCEEMLDRFGQSENVGVFCHAARACVLAPKAAPDPMVPVQLAERAVSRDPREWTIYTLGMAHLRAGQLDEAAERFQESLKTDPNWIARFLNWLGLALVHHARGETEESQEWLDKAVDLMEQHHVMGLQDRLEGQLLRREVEQLLGKSKQEKDDTESEQKAPVAKPKPKDGDAAKAKPPAPEAKSIAKPEEKQE